MTNREPAFPCSNEQFTHGNPQTGDAWSGMTLRDWFAGMAMCRSLSDGIYVDSIGMQGISQAAYEMADAMLKARA